MDWPERLLAWIKPISVEIPLLFGFKVVSPHGDRVWDWIRVSPKNEISLVDPGEQAQGLSVGAGHIGMTRVAWSLSGGFNEDAVGDGEETEFVLRAAQCRKIPLLFCDALTAVRIRV
jgi:hypothetical protein